MIYHRRYFPGLELHSNAQLCRGIYVILDLVLWNSYTCVWSYNVKIEERPDEEYPASLQWAAGAKRKYPGDLLFHYWLYCLWTENMMDAKKEYIDIRHDIHENVCRIPKNVINYFHLDLESRIPW